MGGLPKQVLTINRYSAVAICFNAAIMDELVKFVAYCGSYATVLLKKVVY
jgi:hypothetical protein